MDIKGKESHAMEVWARIDAELKRRNKSRAWLAERLGHTGRSTMGNWVKRGVPPTEYGAIAVALGESIDWLVGRAPPRRQEPAKLTPMALRIAQEFDLIESDERQVDAFAKIVGIITRAREP